MGQWITEDLPHAVVVRPLDDLIRHSDNEHCVCVPEVTRVVYSCFDHGRPKIAVRKYVEHQEMTIHDEDEGEVV